MSNSPVFHLEPEKQYDDFFKRLASLGVDFTRDFDKLEVYEAFISKVEPQFRFLMPAHEEVDYRDWASLADKFASAPIDGEFFIGSQRDGFDSALTMKLYFKDGDDFYVISAAPSPSSVGVQKLWEAGAWHQHCRTVMTFNNGELSFREDEGRKIF